MQVRFLKAEAIALNNMLNNAYISAEDVQSKYETILPVVMELTPITTDNNVNAPMEHDKTKELEEVQDTINSTSKASTTATKGTIKPATGDRTGINGLLGAIGISGITAVFVNRKRRNKK